MYKKFLINQTKIKGSCQLGSKVVPHNSKSYFPLNIYGLFNNVFWGLFLNWTTLVSFEFAEFQSFQILHWSKSRCPKASCAKYAKVNKKVNFRFWNPNFHRNQVRYKKTKTKKKTCYMESSIFWNWVFFKFILVFSHLTLHEMLQNLLASWVRINENHIVNDGSFLIYFIHF